MRDLPLQQNSSHLSSCPLIPMKLVCVPEKCAASLSSGNTVRTCSAASYLRACNGPPCTQLEVMRQSARLPGRMAWVPVNFDSVRYSSKERTHYFYDPEHPQWIQFPRCDKWSSWHVRYVKQYALCNTPLQTQTRIKNIAEKADVSLLDIPSATQKTRPLQSSTSPAPSSHHAGTSSQAHAKFRYPGVTGRQPRTAQRQLLLAQRPE
jgi:hypothetical protein